MAAKREEIEDDPAVLAARAARQSKAALSQLDDLREEFEGGMTKVGRVEKRLDEIKTDVDSLGRGIASLSNRLTLQWEQAQEAAKAAEAEEEEAKKKKQRDWLRVAEPIEAFGWLVELDEYHAKIWRREHQPLAPCWPWHVNAVQVLLAIMATRAQAYEDRGNSPERVSDYRGRWLPNAIGEMKAILSDCDMTTHSTNGGETQYKVDATQLKELAEWHVANRGGDPPGLTKI